MRIHHPQDEIIQKNLLFTVLISFCLLSTIADVLAIEPANDAHQIIPVEYNGVNGNLIFKIDITPFQARTAPVDNMDKMSVGVCINYDKCVDTGDVCAFERFVDGRVEVKGGEARNQQLMTVYIGYNVTSLRIVTDIGYSGIWVISPKPIGINEVAYATPGELKNFWLLAKNIPSGDPGTLAVESLVVNSSTYYSQCADHLQQIGYDYAKPIFLPTKFTTTIKSA